jgi:hypothetical protein
VKICGMSALSDFLEDRIVYRNLRPADDRLISLGGLGKKLGLPSDSIPRKNEHDYARVVVEILKHARQLTIPGTAIRRVVFLGDTRLLDSTAFANICIAGGWPGIAFIGSENPNPPKVETETVREGQTLYLSNRWADLDALFRESVANANFPIDEHTALLIDMDKTALGARGRNAAVIDNARVAAVEETVASFLADLFNAKEFRTAYDLLVQTEFHIFTGDNQDYLAYVCLILGSGLEPLDRLVKRIRAEEIRTFHQFILEIDARKSELPAALQSIHKKIWANVRAGDPTPFKAFRYNEFRTTTAHMGCLADSASLGEFLSGEILLTREVRDLALAWQTQGALTFGLSDKPDEASIPTAELRAQGFVTLHQKKTHVLGS